MLKIFQHLLPNAKAWNLTVSKKLRDFFSGLTSLISDVKVYCDLVFGDIDPSTTRQLDEWESQFGLSKTTLSDSERRIRLDATWKALGGQSPRYIQDTLRNNGFNVYVHEWWVPGTEPETGVHGVAEVRNPLDYLRPTQVFHEGVSNPTLGYPLVNKVNVTRKIEPTMCGNDPAMCGLDDAMCGYYTGIESTNIDYDIPDNSELWPYFVYIGAETFPDHATIDASRRDEFENLCLKICPSHLWIGMLVDYS